MAEPASHVPYEYDLSRLFVDQPEWFAREAVPHTLAWLGAPIAPLCFSILLGGDRASELTLRWSRDELARHLPDLDASVARLIEGRSIHTEQVPQYGAYGLAGVVASAVLGVRVLRLSAWSAPDLVFDSTPGALRGIEVAGRSHRGATGLRELAEEKAPRLRSTPGVVEAWLSLWCAAPAVSLLLQVKP